MDLKDKPFLFKTKDTQSHYAPNGGGAPAGSNPFKKETFDVVTLIGVLEYARVYGGPGGEVKLLQQARSYLKPDGLLVLAMENQLGLKYFAGIPEIRIIFIKRCLVRRHYQLIGRH